MAQKTLLQIIQAAQGELGLAQDTVVVTSQQQTTIQMYGYANQEIEELRQRHTWTALQKEYNLVVNVPVEVTGDTSLNSPLISNVTSGISLLKDSSGNQVYDASGAPVYTVGPINSAVAANYFSVIGSNIPVGARVLSVTATTVTMTMEATGTEVGADITFAQDMYPEPSDFNSFINETWWDRTNRWQLLGPTSPQLDQWHLSGIVATGPRRYFRQLGALANTYRIWPPPVEITNPIQIVFEYLSQDAVYVSGGTTTAPLFANDADIPILSDRAVINGIKWRFWEQKGFSWESKRTDYDNYVDRLIARDGGRETLSMNKRVNPLYLTSFNTQDGNFPGPGNS